jgi:hypothetical protein
MKKSILIISLLLFFGIASSLADCDLKVSMVNQDPYPAVPGDYVKILFQVSGVESTDCGDISFKLLENYPLRFDPGFNPIQTFKSGTFSKGYSPNWIVPYSVRIDSSALDGDAEIEVLYSTLGRDSFKLSETYKLRVEEVRADFHVFVRSYDYSTNRLVLEVLNIARNDIKSLVLTVPSQEDIKILGGNKNIVGDLDSNDYTSTDFTAIPSDGKILVILEYTDKTGERRSLEKEVLFESEYFQHTKPDSSGMMGNLAIATVLILGFFLWRYFKKKKKKLLR